MKRSFRSVLLTILRVIILTGLILTIFIWGADRHLSVWLVLESVIIAGVLDFILPYRLPAMEESQS